MPSEKITSTNVTIIDDHRDELNQQRTGSGEGLGEPTVAAEIQGGSKRPEVLASAIRAMAIHLGALADDRSASPAWLGGLVEGEVREVRYEQSYERFSDTSRMGAAGY